MGRLYRRAIRRRIRGLFVSNTRPIPEVQGNDVDNWAFDHAYDLSAAQEYRGPIVLAGVATWYGPGFYGEPLACDRGQGLRYEPSGVLWAAIDHAYMQHWQCGDRLRIDFNAGQAITVTLLDTGAFRQYYVEQWGADQPIVVDVSEYAWPFDLSVLSAPAQVTNLTHRERIRGGSNGP